MKYNMYDEKMYFRWTGEDVCREPFNYTKCGLSNVWLVNGYRIEYFHGDWFTSVVDVDDLHRAIALRILKGCNLSTEKNNFIKKVVVYYFDKIKLPLEMLLVAQNLKDLADNPDDGSWPKKVLELAEKIKASVSADNSREHKDTWV